MKKPDDQERPSGIEPRLLKLRQTAATINGYTSRHPGLVVILVDLSASMNLAWGGDGDSKSDLAWHAVNKVCCDLTARCRKLSHNKASPEECWDSKVFLSILGYRTRTENGREIPEVIHILEGWPEKFGPHWRKDGGPLAYAEDLEWSCSGDTPMAFALDYVHEYIQGILSVTPEGEGKSPLSSGFPPCVLHITDGEADDFQSSTPGDPSRGRKTREAAGKLSSITVQGQDLAFLNLMISPDYKGTIVFPDKPPPGEWSNFLWEISSKVPGFIKTKLEFLADTTSGPRVACTSESRGFIITDDAGILVDFLRWGTIYDS